MCDFFLLIKKKIDNGLNSNYSMSDISGRHRKLAGLPLFGTVLLVKHPSYLIAAAVIVIVLVNIVVSKWLVKLPIFVL